ncbi:hypothetical protein [uncultured Microscilla sp.]|uniref:hypothetical protein n=1 Tax=uncultured Microscilla sp. TaxID=432653 RepID=UPI002624A5A0|nr:hypothetical protein [uncultured Microscilla sp.]
MNSKITFKSHKRKPRHRYWWLWLVVLCIGSIAQAQAQAPELGMLKMTNSKYGHYYNTGIDLNALLKNGQVNKARIEFWATGGSNWSLTDMRPDDENFRLHMKHNNKKNALIFNYGAGNELTAEDFTDMGISNPKLTGSGEKWYHIALDIEKFTILSADRYFLHIYINGEPQAITELPSGISTTGERYLYFYRDGGESSSVTRITELRAWDRISGAPDNYWMQTFANLSNLETYTSNGLEHVFGVYDDGTTYVSTMQAIAGLDELTKMEWKDRVTDTKGTGVDHYDNSTVLLLVVDAEANGADKHPVLLLDDPHFHASKGSYDDRIKLSWHHIDGITSYTLAQDGENIGDAQIDGSNLVVGQLVTYWIEDIAPGTAHEYTLKTQGSGSESYTSAGFVAFNGSIEGKVTSSLGIGTQGVLIKAASATPHNKVLRLDADSDPLEVNHADIFRTEEHTARDFMVEFWLKSSATTNTVEVLQVGNYTIQLTEDKLSVIKEGGDYVHFSLADNHNINEWHHYAIILDSHAGHTNWHKYGSGTTGKPGGLLAYVDGESIHYESGATLLKYEPDQTAVNQLQNFQLNVSATEAYYLDEFRIWDASQQTVGGTEETHQQRIKRLHHQIQAMYPCVVSNSQEHLLLRYSFDINTSHETFNWAKATQGTWYTAHSASTVLNTETSEAKDLSYAAYTSSSGLYEIAGINYGSSAEYTVTPSKSTDAVSTFEFAPSSKTIRLRASSSSSAYQHTGVDFTDRSSLLVSGKMYYEAKVDGVTKQYPIPVGRGLRYANLDGTTAEKSQYTTLATADGTELATQHDGTYAITLPPGNQRLRPTATSEKRSFPALSLYFDGVDDYAKSANTWVMPGAASTTDAIYMNSLTWSLFVRPVSDADAPAGDQTILQIGDIRLKLINNNDLVLYKGTTERAKVPGFVQDVAGDNNSEWKFIAFTFDKSSGKVTLYTEAHYEGTAANHTFAAGDFNGQQVVLGANYDGSSSYSEYYKGNLHLLELRESAYSAENVEKLGECACVDNDDDNLYLSFRFAEHKKSPRVLSSTSNAAAYIIDLVDPNTPNDYAVIPTIDDRYANPYTRSYHDDIVAVTSSDDGTITRADHDGDGTLSVYDLNVTAALEEVDFRIDTRYGLVGNLIIPCMESLEGTFEVIVTRTDYQEDHWTKTYSSDDQHAYYVEGVFNSDKTVFVIDDLMPGIYQVVVKHTPTGGNQETLLTQYGVDLRKDWQQVNILHEPPIEMSLKVTEMFVDSDNDGVADNWVPFDQATYNYSGKGRKAKGADDTIDTEDDIYNLPLMTAIKVKATFTYKNSNSGCQVRNQEYTLGGDLALAIAKNDTTVTGTLTSTTGSDELVILTSTPNFNEGSYGKYEDYKAATSGYSLPTGISSDDPFPFDDYLRKLIVEIPENTDGEPTSDTLNAWVTGKVQNPNVDFALTTPNVLKVLYDPPGDGSSINLSEGTSLSYSYSRSSNHTVSASLGGGSYINHEAAANAPLIWKKLTKVNIKQGVSNETSAVLAFNGKNQSRSLSFNRSISTASGSVPLPGIQQDVFIGTYTSLQIGSGKELKIEYLNNPGVEKEIKAVVADLDNTYTLNDDGVFVFTRNEIEQIQLPLLQTAFEDNFPDVKPASPDYTNYNTAVGTYNTQRGLVKSAGGDISELPHLKTLGTGEDIPNPTDEQIAYAMFIGAPTFDTEGKRTGAVVVSSGNPNGLSDDDLETKKSQAQGAFLGLYCFKRHLETSIITRHDIADPDNDTYKGVYKSNSAGELELSFQAPGSTNGNLEKFAFSGGVGAITHAINKSASETTLDEYNNGSTSTGYQGSGEFYFVAAGLYVNTSIKHTYSTNSSTNTGNGSSEGYSITLNDNDEGDQFEVIVKDDGKGSPVTVAVAGRSMCPVEQNTNAREGVEITNVTTPSVNADGDLVFEVTVKNTQEAEEAANNGYYKVYKLRAFVPNGLKMKVENYDDNRFTSEGYGFGLDKDGTKTFRIVAQRASADAAMSFAGVKIVAYSACDAGSGAMNYYLGQDVNSDGTRTMGNRHYRPIYNVLANSQGDRHVYIDETKGSLVNDGFVPGATNVIMLRDYKLMNLDFTKVDAQWNKANHTVTQAMGTNETFTATLTSAYPSARYYNLSLPSWLAVNNPAPGSTYGNYELPANHAHPMSFTTSSSLATGVHNGQVVATIYEEDGNGGLSSLGTTTLDVRVVVECPNNYSIDPADFPYQMVTKFTFTGTHASDLAGKTLLAREGGTSTGTLLGKSIVETGGTDVYTTMVVYGTSATTTYSLYVVNEASCNELELYTGLTFENGAYKTESIGYSGANEGYALTLSPGYHWLSWQLSDAAGNATITKANRIFGLDAADELYVLNALGTDVSGAVTFKLDTSYQIYVAAERTLTIKGTRSTPDQITQTITGSGTPNTRGDFQPLAYFLAGSQSLSGAFATFSCKGTDLGANPGTTLEGIPESTIVLSQTAYAIYNNGAWVGSLTTLEPNQGYLIALGSGMGDGETTTTLVSIDQASIKFKAVSSQRITGTVEAADQQVRHDAANLGLLPQVHQYPHTAQVTGILEGAETLGDEHAYMVVAFATHPLTGNKEVRGIAIPQRLDGQWHYFMVAYALEAGEQLSFELVNRQEGKERYALDNVLSFEPHSITGSLEQPYAFRLSESGQAQTGIDLQLMSAPNPVSQGATATLSYRLPEAGQVTLTISNVQGTTVATLKNNEEQDAGNHTTAWHTQGQATGTYIATLRFVNPATQQVVVKRLVIQ